MASDRYGIYSGSFVHAGGTLDLTQLREQGISAGSRYHLVRPGGALNPHAHILSTANPVIRFRTSDLASVLATVDIASGLYCSGGHVMRYQQRAPGGTFTGSTSNVTQSTTKGFLHITSIEVDIDSENGAEAELEYIALSTDGSNPITNTPSVSFAAAPAPAFGSIYFMGGCWLGSSQVEGLTRLRISPGIRFVSRRCDGGVFPRSGASSITAREPAVEMTFLNAALPYSIGSFFTYALGAAVKNYLQRGTAAADGRIAVGSSSHYRFDVAAGSWGHDNIAVADENDALVTVRIMPTGLLSLAAGVAIG
jgi:hypothetical protein